MGKKRKGGRSGGEKSKIGSDIDAVSRFGQDETFNDSQDDFFAGKDHILLDEGPAKKRRKQIEEQEQYLEPSDEEVLRYDEDEEEDNDDEEAYEEEDMDEGNAQFTDENDGEEHPDSEEEGGINNWGTSKADYYDADEIETEADALDEQTEAERLRNQFLQRVPAVDMGFDEEEWKLAEAEQDRQQKRVTQHLPDEAVMEDTPLEKRLQILEKRYPELESLADDYLDLQPLYKELREAAASTSLPTHSLSRTSKTSGIKKPEPLAITNLKWRALSAYLGSIALYFVVLTSPASGKSEPVAPLSRTELSKHPVMATLFKARTSWDAVKDLQEAKQEELEIIADQKSDMKIGGDSVPQQTMPTSEPVPSSTKRKEKVRKPKKEKQPTSTSSSSKVDAKTHRKESNRKPDAILTELDNLIADIKKSGNNTRPLKSKSSVAHPKTRHSSESRSDSDFGDEAPLTGIEAQNKAQRSKSLRFYTSQLAQKSNKRDAASRDAGGDADLPYKERLKDRQARLMREAEKRGGDAAEQSQRLDYQDEDDDDESDQEKQMALAKQVRGDENDQDGDEEDYYQTISSRTAAKKASRAAAHASTLTSSSATHASAQANHENGTTELGGKRGITYEIAANKGLMPRRKKEVRNPRVKKRMRYDEKMRKLGSVRQVWKGGEAKGGYAGELTGIKTNLVRSVKL